MGEKRVGAAHTTTTTTMSRRKHLEQQMQEVPEMDVNHSVARVVKLHGTNIVQVEAPGPGPSGELDALEECLCLLPAKFSKRFWVKRGNFVVIEFTVAKDHSSSNKIKGTITHILYPDQVKKLRKDQRAATAIATTATVSRPCRPIQTNPRATTPGG